MAVLLYPKPKAAFRGGVNGVRRNNDPYHQSEYLHRKLISASSGVLLPPPKTRLARTELSMAGQTLRKSSKGKSNNDADHKSKPRNPPKLICS